MARFYLHQNSALTAFLLFKTLNSKLNSLRIVGMKTLTVKLSSEATFECEVRE
jgi:hypothetical protein